MGWLDKVLGKQPSFPHDAPDLEATMPSRVAGRTLVTWSVSGNRFWGNLDRQGGGRLRSALGPELDDAGLPPDSIRWAAAQIICASPFASKAVQGSAQNRDASAARLRFDGSVIARVAA